MQPLLPFILIATFLVIIWAGTSPHPNSKSRARRDTVTVEERQQLTNTTSHVPALCPDGWLSIPPYCYYLNKTNVTYTRAQEFCNSQSAHLPYFKNENFWTEMVIGSSAWVSPGIEWAYWLGLDHRDVPFELIWNDGTRLNDTYGHTFYASPWFICKPNGHSWDCLDCAYCGLAYTGLYYGYRWLWFDENCDYKYWIVCQVADTNNKGLEGGIMDIDLKTEGSRLLATTPTPALHECKFPDIRLFSMKACKHVALIAAVIVGIISILLCCSFFLYSCYRKTDLKKNGNNEIM